MKLVQLIEMVCDWWGTTAYVSEDPIVKFLDDSTKNLCKYEFNGYQKFVIERTRDFIAKDDTCLIKIIFKGCTNYDKGSIPLRTSDCDSEVQFYRELNDFLKGRIALLNLAKARGNFTERIR